MWKGQSHCVIYKGEIEQVVSLRFLFIRCQTDDPKHLGGCDI